MNCFGLDSTIPYQQKTKQMRKGYKIFAEAFMCISKNGSCYLFQKPLVEPDTRVPGLQTDTTYNSLDFHEHF